ncbi:MAG: hypothetical protein AB3N15_01695 [Paracoccaceae bacterium]
MTIELVANLLNLADQLSKEFDRTTPAVKTILSEQRVDLYLTKSRKAAVGALAEFSALFGGNFVRRSNKTSHGQPSVFSR